MSGSTPARPWSGITRTLLTIGAAVAFIGAVALIADTQPPGPDLPGDATRGGPQADVNPEAAEQAEQAEERQEAYEQAEEQGKVGQARPTGQAAAAPVAGWAGERPVDTVADDWEPAIATDPHAPYVYTLVTRYAGKPCNGNCPSPWMALNVSTDGGVTWNAGAPLCACKGSGQFDPIIEVVPNTGAV